MRRSDIKVYNHARQMIQFLYSLLILLAAWLENKNIRASRLSQKKGGEVSAGCLGNRGRSTLIPESISKKKVGMKKRGPPSDSIRVIIFLSASTVWCHRRERGDQSLGSLDRDGVNETIVDTIGGSFERMNTPTSYLYIYHFRVLLLKSFYLPSFS